MIFILVKRVAWQTLYYIVVNNYNSYCKCHIHFEGGTIDTVNNCQDNFLHLWDLILWWNQYQIFYCKQNDCWFTKYVDIRM